MPEEESLIRKPEELMLRLPEDFFLSSLVVTCKKCLSDMRIGWAGEAKEFTVDAMRQQLESHRKGFCEAKGAREPKG